MGFRDVVRDRVEAPASAIDYGGAWLRAFLVRGSGLDVDETQKARIAALEVERATRVLDPTL